MNRITKTNEAGEETIDPSVLLSLEFEAAAKTHVVLPITGYDAFQLVNGLMAMERFVIDRGMGPDEVQRIQELQRKVIEHGQFSQRIRALVGSNRKALKLEELG